MLIENIQLRTTALPTLATWLAFNIFWFLCVAHSAWALPSFVLLLAGAWWMFAKLASQVSLVLKREALWLLAMGLFGFIFESILFQCQLLVAQATAQTQDFAPLWLVLVWGGFGLSYRYGLVKLANLGLWLCALGALAVLSYWGGTELNPQVALGQPIGLSLLIIAASWAVLLPLSVRIYGRYFYVV